jgi:hypothetical protein
VKWEEEAAVEYALMSGAYKEAARSRPTEVMEWMRRWEEAEEGAG